MRIFGLEIRRAEKALHAVSDWRGGWRKITSLHWSMAAELRGKEGHVAVLSDSVRLSGQHQLDGAAAFHASAAPG